MKKKDKVILVDCDGVLLDWLYAFETWMFHQGFRLKDESTYSVDERYGISKNQKNTLIRFFNESASIGFIPPLRDSIYYIKQLHQKHGYVFHCITSLSHNQNAQELRKMNIEKLFGKGIFEKFVFLDTGADKDEELRKYADTGCWWIEDKPENAQVGKDFGLNSVLIAHEHNIDSKFPRFSKWKHLYNHITEANNV
jgi:FMN phosphatase YigB (HAD superfamily)